MGRTGLREERSWGRPLWATLALPSGERGPVERRALRRLASICNWEDMGHLGEGRAVVEARPYKRVSTGVAGFRWLGELDD